MAARAKRHRGPAVCWNGDECPRHRWGACLFGHSFPPRETGAPSGNPFMEGRGRRAAPGCAQSCGRCNVAPWDATGALPARLQAQRPPQERITERFKKVQEIDVPVATGCRGRARAASGSVRFAFAFLVVGCSRRCTDSEHGWWLMSRWSVGLPQGQRGFQLVVTTGAVEDSRALTTGDHVLQRTTEGINVLVPQECGVMVEVPETASHDRIQQRPGPYADNPCPQASQELALQERDQNQAVARDERRFVCEGKGHDDESHQERHFCPRAARS